MGLKVWDAFRRSRKVKDTTSLERLEYGRIRSVLSGWFREYLVQESDVLRFEVDMSVLDGVLDYLSSEMFMTRYEFLQESESVFAIRLRSLE